MNRPKILIIGILAGLTATLWSGTARAADICNPNSIKTHYQGIYCGIRLNDNESADEDIIETLAEQFGMDEDIVKEVLDGTICLTVSGYSEEEKNDLPASVRNACLPSGLSTATALSGWNIFTDIRNAYEKENVIQKSAKSLKFKFKASEQYWDGRVGDVGDAPFDLIVDLNLIEIVLFGSKAQWMQDVYSFPEEEDGESGGGGMDGALPPEDEESETPATPGESPSEEGVTTTTEEEGGEPAEECVPPTDPQADTGAGPSSSYQNPSCGDGALDVLIGEECDDGNRQSGDGCNQYCRLESAGSSDMCVDPEAVTFKSPPTPSEGPATSTTAASGTTGGPGSPAGQSASCPPGTVPKKTTTTTGPEADTGAETVTQSPEYPGPYLGGTLKKYPESTPPACPPGESAIETTTPTTVEDEDTGETKIVSEKHITCIPTEFCADFNAARDFLFGEGWEDNEQLVNIAPAIEAMFCVSVKKENRPKSPYQMIEGCVDCHITAMVDALEKALETNVSPLVNTTSAFSISSKYGPAFSFNLNTAVKRVIRYFKTDTAKTAISAANREAANALRNNLMPEIARYTTESPLQTLSGQSERINTAMENIREETRMFGMTSNAVSDQEVGGRIIPLLTQMRDSIINIESKYEGLVGSLKLDEKEQCK